MFLRAAIATPGVVYADGHVDCPDHVWGSPDAVL